MTSKKRVQQLRWKCPECKAEGWWVPSTNIGPYPLIHDRPDGRQCLKSRAKTEKGVRHILQRVEASARQCPGCCSLDGEHTFDSACTLKEEA